VVPLTPQYAVRLFSRSLPKLFHVFFFPFSSRWGTAPPYFPLASALGQALMGCCRWLYPGATKKKTKKFLPSPVNFILWLSFLLALGRLFASLTLPSPFSFGLAPFSLLTTKSVPPLTLFRCYFTFFEPCGFCLGLLFLFYSLPCPLFVLLGHVFGL